MKYYKIFSKGNQEEGLLTEKLAAEKKNRSKATMFSSCQPESDREAWNVPALPQCCHAESSQGQPAFPLAVALSLV